MSAYHALDAARAAGFEVQLDGRNLAVSGIGELPTDIGDNLRRHKHSIRAALQQPLVPRAPLQPILPWDATDWRAFYDERAAIAEFDQGLSRVEAEVLAYEHCFGEWLGQNPVYSPSDRCLRCADTARASDVLLPVGIAGAGEVWLHRACSTAWCTIRYAEAVSGLAAMGITDPTGGSP